MANETSALDACIFCPLSFERRCSFTILRYIFQPPLAPVVAHDMLSNLLERLHISARNKFEDSRPCTGTLWDVCRRSLLAGLIWAMTLGRTSKPVEQCQRGYLTEGAMLGYLSHVGFQVCRTPGATRCWVGLLVSLTSYAKVAPMACSHDARGSPSSATTRIFVLPAGKQLDGSERMRSKQSIAHGNL